MAFNDQRLQILLKEYETGAQEAASVASRLWQYTAILSIIGAGLLAFAAQSDLVDLLKNGALDIEIILLGGAMFIFSLIWFPVF